MKDPIVLFEQDIEETDTIAGEVIPPWHRWLLYVEAAKARCEIPLDFYQWGLKHGLEVEPEQIEEGKT